MGSGLGLLVILLSSRPRSLSLNTSVSNNSKLFIRQQKDNLPLLRAQLQLPLQLRTRFLPMYKIAKPTPHASLSAVQPATRFSEIRHGTEFAVDRPRGVPARVECVAGLLRRVLVFEARVDVADEICVSINVSKKSPQSHHVC